MSVTGNDEHTIQSGRGSYWTRKGLSLRWELIFLFFKTQLYILVGINISYIVQEPSQGEKY